MLASPVLDNHWELFGLAVCASGSASGWLASVIDDKKVYLLAIPVFVLLFSIPAINLCLNLGFISGNGPVPTFKKMAPIAGGIGWALVFLSGERLFYQQLEASQSLFYIFASIRPQLDWALDCDHGYNSQHCFPLLGNVTAYKADPKNKPKVGGFDHPKYDYPQNHWPAQEFNRYFLWNQHVPENESKWFEGSWYFATAEGMPKFYLSFPALILTFCHLTVWAMIFGLLYKFGENIGYVAIRYLVIVPVAIFSLVTLAMCLFGLDFRAAATYIFTSKAVNPLKSQGDAVPAYHFIIFDMFRVNLACMECSSALTGILILFASFYKPKTGTVFTTYGAVIIALLQLVAPFWLAVLRLGCLGHLKDVQPDYVAWQTNDVVFTFDTFPSCAATASFGPLWAFLYYIAHFIYAQLGPMVVLVLFLHNSLVDGFVIFERNPNKLLGGICGLYAFFGLLLCMPLGSTAAYFFSWISQSSIPELFALFTVLFLYGWTNLRLDTGLVLNIRDHGLGAVLFGPNSTLYTIMLFTSVPALLATKFVSVFDFMTVGRNIVVHVDKAALFVSKALWFNRLVGYTLLLTPPFMLLYGAGKALHHYWFQNKLAFSTVCEPTPEWRMHTRLESDRETRRPAPLSHTIFTKCCVISYKTGLIIVFVMEMFILGFAWFLTCWNIYGSYVFHTDVARYRAAATMFPYRSVMLLLVSVYHTYAQVQLGKLLKLWDSAGRLTPYIFIATVQMAFFNGYLVVFSYGYTRDMVGSPFSVILMSTVLRGGLISFVVALRWFIRESQYNRTNGVEVVIGSGSNNGHNHHPYQPAGGGGNHRLRTDNDLVNVPADDDLDQDGYGPYDHDTVETNDRENIVKG